MLAVLLGGHHNLLWFQECARAVLVFVFGLVLVRVAGRRVFGKWAALDIVVSIVVGSNLSRTLTGNAPLLGTLAATALLMALHWLLALGAARSHYFSRLVEGAPIILYANGALVERNRLRHTVSVADIEESLRAHGTSRIEDVSQIILEPSGKINVKR